MKKIFSAILAAVMLLSCLPAAAYAAESRTFTNVDTVMIYNPLTSASVTMSTGNMLGQIRTDSGHFLMADGEDEDSFYFSDQDHLLEELEGVESEKASDLAGISAAYKNASVGDTNTFFYQPKSSYTGASATFTCLYSGSRCQIWGYGYSNYDIADLLGSEFDNNIYNSDISHFGPARYLEDGAKLNILIYSMYSNGLCGYFRPLELLTASEMGTYYAGKYNSGQAIIHINSYYCSATKYDTVGYVTIAHEFQHLINLSSSIKGSDDVSSPDTMGTWLNESMSMQAEELLYPGEVENMGYVSRDYNDSYGIANGQSLYDFSNNSGDIGVYGQAYLFSEYLKKQTGGDTVFRNLHLNWSGSGTKTDAANLYAVMPSAYKNALDSAISYDGSTKTAVGADSSNFLSKLNLAFQIACAINQSSGVYSVGSAGEAADPRVFVGSACSIAGGGRIIVRTEDENSYTVPAGADSRLIYVGFKDGVMTMAPTTAANYSDGASYSITAVSSNESYGTVSLSGNTITAHPADGYGYASPAYTVLSGSASVKHMGNTFTVSPSCDCTVQICFAPKDSSVDVWDGSYASYLPYSGGHYTISSGAELGKFALMVLGGTDFDGQTVVLTKNIDLDGRLWTCIGSSTTKAFEGTFDGCGYTISNLTVGSASEPRTQSGSGLFGYAYKATIKNLNVENAAIYGRDSSAIIAGGASDSNFINCRVSGIIRTDVDDSSYIGGIAGYHPDQITGCYADVDIAGYSNVGGIVGYATDTVISNCESHGKVSAHLDGGGIAGDLSRGSISSSWSDAAIGTTITDNSTLGGIAGDCYGGSVSLCYFTGKVTGMMDIGGIAGSAANGTTLSQCYSAATLTSKYASSTGMILGDLSTYSDPVTFSGCYFYNGLCSAAVKNASRSGCVGLSYSQCKEAQRYAGWDFSGTWNIDSAVNNGMPFLRWQVFEVTRVSLTGETHLLYPGESTDLTVSVLPLCAMDRAYTLVSSNPAVATVNAEGHVTAVGTGLTTITLTAACNGMKASFDIDVLTPDAIVTGFASGSGTKQDPYIVETLSNLVHLTQMVNYGYSFEGEYIRQTADIDLGCNYSNQWIPIGSSSGTPFMGQYEGAGHRITNLYINDSGVFYQGLFGAIKNATISSIDLDESTLVNGFYVGGIVAYAEDSNILNCNTLENVSFSVNSACAAGGVVGEIRDTGAGSAVGFCSNAASISSSSGGVMLGGVVAWVLGGSAQIVGCRNSAQIKALSDLSYTGGIVGALEGKYLLDCCNTGSVKGYGSTAGIVGWLDSGWVYACYNTGAISNSGMPSGGIVGTENGAGLRVISCYNASTVSASIYGYYSGIVGYHVSANISGCYYVNGTTSDSRATGITPAAMKSSGASYLGTGWTYAAGENNGYPVLEIFAPNVIINDYRYDLAAFSTDNTDLTVQVNRMGNVLINVDGIEEKYLDVGTDSLTISREYLATLAPGEHEFTARFGAHCGSTFGLYVHDSTPGEYLMKQTSSAVKSGNVQFGLRFSAPEDSSVCLVVAAYESGRQVSLKMVCSDMDHGSNDISVTLPNNPGWEYRAYLMDPVTHTALTEQLSLTASESMLQTTGFASSSAASDLLKDLVSRETAVLESMK